MKKFLHIGLNFHARPIKTQELESVFNTADDWLRYAANCWIVWTSETPQDWYNKLKPKLDAEDTLFICEVNVSNRQGFLTKPSWEWLNKVRG